jgi:hypothetical protein
MIQGNSAPDLHAQWALIKKEILGVQLLYRTLCSLYWDAPDPANDLFKEAPLVCRVIQTSLAESALARLARLMDAEMTGKKANLSLRRISEAVPALQQEIEALRQRWTDSPLRLLRNQYLSHNDLVSLTSNEHTLNIPLSDDDIKTLAELINELKNIRQLVNFELGMPDYLDAPLELQVRREAELVERMLSNHDHG